MIGRILFIRDYFEQVEKALQDFPNISSYTLKKGILTLVIWSASVAS